MGTLDKINHDQRLYVIRESGGYSCLGFKVADKRGRAYAAWAGVEFPAADIGTAEHFAAYEGALRAVLGMCRETGRPCDVELIPELDRWYGWRVEVRHPDGTTERFNVGRSMGPIRINLALHNRRSIGGPAAWFPPGSTVRPIRRA